MLILKLNARLSTFAQLMVRVVWPSTASSAPTEPSSTRTTSSATGGSTLTATRLRVSTLRMRRLLRSGKLLLLPPQIRPLTEHRLPLATLPELLLLPQLLLHTLLVTCLLPLHLVLREPMKQLSGLAGSWATTGAATGAAANRATMAAEVKRAFLTPGYVCMCI
jgi:hypothetical protein